ncbi:MAG: hypothetical protein COW01_09300 [Bdellovibrionales bacterium CG12_big_fil_rev_8_21_14_0_65_38_15]|nr:MAG: hypothetical protein COW79_09305 [Bdellovibrionales bacterium CG22_combo_CG10-13_8_21_14_all_38_13]PIQ54723.1 MAG: hypothetical protein COW01_09300 [Bdellovibrionales bacterium CG12_big_fil_rev_8_21_14_0_65_38_15]PIR30871.1 MAG: hypothetical protein COV38_03485 [Bdellovibrionales bacterium CG11_big_fil_rev_8_21_14_0_20_38_13]
MRALFFIVSLSIIPSIVHANAQLTTSRGSDVVELLVYSQESQSECQLKLDETTKRLESHGKFIVSHHKQCGQGIDSRAPEYFAGKIVILK